MRTYSQGDTWDDILDKGVKQITHRSPTGAPTAMFLQYVFNVFIIFETCGLYVDFLERSFEDRAAYHLSFSGV